MTKFDIEIVSDTICPWCYVGKQKLDQAIKTYKELHPESGDEFSTTWKPFYLHPETPKAGVDKIAWFRSKYGDDRTKMIFERLTQVGRDVGINFKFGGKIGNTRDSHRLIQLGKSKSPAVQTRVVEELFAMFFEQEGDVSDHAALRKAGVKAGLEGKEVDDWLQSDKGGKAVDEEVEAAQGNQISGVPNFTVQGKYEVGGAQDPGVFLRLFEKIKAAEGGSKA